MTTFREFLNEATCNFVDADGNSLEIGKWYSYSKGNSGRGQKIFIVDVGNTVKFKNQNSSEVWEISGPVFDRKYKGYLTRK